MMSQPIYHLTSRREWHHAQFAGEYKPKGFDKEGFIHASHKEQVVQVANTIFRGQGDLVLLVIDRSKLRAKVIDENLSGGAGLFPHIYGLLPVEAVTDMILFPCKADGTFTLPEGLETSLQ